VSGFVQTLSLDAAPEQRHFTHLYRQIAQARLEIAPAFIASLTGFQSFYSSFN
jgi:hypothetical protein